MASIVYQKEVVGSVMRPDVVVNGAIQINLRISNVFKTDFIAMIAESVFEYSSEPCDLERVS